MTTDKIWLKRVCIPLWVIQLLVYLIYAGASGVALWAVDAAEDRGYLDDDKYDGVAQTLNIGAAVSLALSVFTIVLVIVEIILAAVHKLKPVANIVFQVIKSLIWSAWFILTIVSVANGGATGLNIFLSLVLL